MRSGTSFAIPPHDGTAAFTAPAVSHEPVVPEPVVVETEGQPGEAVNAETGQVTAPGEPLPEVPAAEGAEPLPVEPAEPLYDPAEHTVIEVLAHLDLLDLTTQAGVEEYARIVVAEHDGKARATLLSQVVEPTLQTPAAPATETAALATETIPTETTPQE